MPRLHTSALWIRVSLLSIAVFNVLSAAAGGWGLTSGGLVQVILVILALGAWPHPFWGRER